MSASYFEWGFKALTDIWTGDAERRGDHLIPTGLMGSIRWWFEVLVRGLGGKACDPSDPKVRCPNEQGRHCVACELFGCTGWARKFRLMVLDGHGNVIQSQIRANTEFVLRFIPLRPIREEEWCLLDLTLRLIADYGAIGGRTVLKPSEEWGIADLGAGDLVENNNQVKVERSRGGLPLRQGDVIQAIDGQAVHKISDLESLLSKKQHGEPISVVIQREDEQKEVKCWAGKRHHQDFGLIQYLQGPTVSDCCKDRRALESYVTGRQWRQDEYLDDKKFSWASLQNFWCVKGPYLARQDAEKSTFNQVIGRKQPKPKKPEEREQDLEQDNPINRWLAGRRQESKKVFSFKHPQEGGRTFGFVKPDTVGFDEIKRRLRAVWSDFNLDNEFKDGSAILAELCG